MKLNLYPENFTVKSSTDEMYCEVKLTDDDLRYALEEKPNEDVSKWSMAIGAYPYEEGYPAEFIISLSKRLLPELKRLMKDNDDGKDCINACQTLITALKDKELTV